MRTKPRLSGRTIAMRCCRASRFASAVRSHCDYLAGANFHLAVHLRRSDGRRLPSGRGWSRPPMGTFTGQREGGANGSGCGTVFKITPTGTLTTLHSFCTCTDGPYPCAALVQATNGNFYGTTEVRWRGQRRWDGLQNHPQRHADHALQLLPPKRLPRRRQPLAGLVQATNGNFYGTTVDGGAKVDGTVFKITPSGTLTTLYSFRKLTDGCRPSAGLIQATMGTSTGQPAYGGANDEARFSKSPQRHADHALQLLLPKRLPGRRQSRAGLVQATDGNLYGTTAYGGLQNCYERVGCGTVFKITPSGTLTTLYSFCSQSGCPDGAYPCAGLVQATDGNLYGTTFEGGTYNSGTVFKITLDGKLTTLHTFRFFDGDIPIAALVQDTNGSFYGTTQMAGPTIWDDLQPVRRSGPVRGNYRPPPARWERPSIFWGPI